MVESMKSFWLVSSLAAVLLVWGCEKVSSSKDLDEIHKTEELAEENRRQSEIGKAELDTELLTQLADDYISFADKYPQSPETPELIFRAGEIHANQLGKTGKAIQLYERIYEKYPDHENAPTALFLSGYLYNNVLHDQINAEKTFKEFIEKYPDHNMYLSAKFELESLGKPIDEVFDMLIRQGDKDEAGKDSAEKVLDDEQ